MRLPCFTLLFIFMLSILVGVTSLSSPTSASEDSVITASRELSASSVYPGESFNVTVQVLANQVLANQVLEAPTLNEDLPVGWSATSLESDGAVFRDTDTFKEASLEWVWAENLSAGKSKTVVYKVTVPEDVEFTNYGISGEVSAYKVPAVSVVGPSPAIEVIMPPPVAAFSANPLSGTVPLSVQFTNLSLYELDSWEWDFNGDNIVDSRLPNPSFTFKTTGTYNVSLTVYRGELNDTETKTGYITVSKTSTVESSGGGGGGGGGGGSPEPNSNIELKEIANQQIFKGTRTRYAFRAETNDVTGLEFDPKKSFGKTTATIESLKNTSSLVPTPPAGKVYRNMNIWVGSSGFSSPENLENAKISFRVNRTWINENNIALSTITLLRFSEEKWNSLPTKQVGEDTKYLYFEAETPGFSPFAITGNQNTGSQDTGSDITQALDGENPSGSETGAAGDGDEASETGTKDKFKSMPGFEVLPLMLCLLLYRIMKRKN